MHLLFNNISSKMLFFLDQKFAIYFLFLEYQMLVFFGDLLRSEEQEEHRHKGENSQRDQRSRRVAALAEGVGQVVAVLLPLREAVVESAVGATASAGGPHRGGGTVVLGEAVEVALVVGSNLVVATDVRGDTDVLVLAQNFLAGVQGRGTTVGDGVARLADGLSSGSWQVGLVPPVQVRPFWQTREAPESPSSPTAPKMVGSQ